MDAVVSYAEPNGRLRCVALLQDALHELKTVVMSLLYRALVFSRICRNQMGDQPLNSIGDAVILAGRHIGILFMWSGRGEKVTSRTPQAVR